MADALGELAAQHKALGLERTPADDLMLIAFKKMLEHFAQIEQEHQKSGPERTHIEMLSNGLDCMKTVVNTLYAIDKPLPSPLAYAMDQMTQHLDPHYPQRAHLFTPPANLTAKSAPNAWMTQVKKALLVALVQLLHENDYTVADACKRVAAAMENAGLSFEDGRTRGRSTRGTRSVERLKEWRKDANAGKFKGEFPELYAKVKVALFDQLSELKVIKSAALAHETLISGVIGKVCDLTCGPGDRHSVGGTDPL